MGQQRSSQAGGGPFTPPQQPMPRRDTPPPAPFVAADDQKTIQRMALPASRMPFVAADDQKTIQRTALPASRMPFPAPQAQPNMPAPYVQGQHARYGPVPANGMPGQSTGFPNGPFYQPQGAGNQPMSAPPQQFGRPPMPAIPHPLNGPPMAAPTQRPAAPFQGPDGPQGFAPVQRPGLPMGPVGMPAGQPAFSQAPRTFNNQPNPGPALMPPARSMVDAPPAPGMFGPNQPMRAGYVTTGQLEAERGRAPRPSTSHLGIWGGPPDPHDHERKRRRRVPIWARVIIGVLVFFLVLGGIGFGYYQVGFAGSVNTIVGQQVQRARGEENPNANLSNGILTGPRVNILLLGSDTDQKFGGNYLAQTDIVVSLDPASKTVSMLSIPRDFYLNVPGYGMHKLDEVYALGGGNNVALSRLTIEQDFGIPINYYAWVGLDGFIKVINEVGGVNVDVLHPIVDDNYPDDVGTNTPYSVKRLYLPAGPQHLDGPTALEYVRSRHADLVGDFGRSARQQQVLSALKTKLEDPTIFSHLSAIAKDLQGSLKTDMQLPDVLKLMNFARSLDTNKINKLILGPPYSTSGVAPAGTPDAGAQIVVPNCAQIIPAIAQMLQLGNNAACNIQGNSAQPSSSLPSAYTRGQPAPSAIQLAQATTLANNASASRSTGLSDPTGVHSLFDLLLLGVFESPTAFQG